MTASVGALPVEPALGRRPSTRAAGTARDLASAPLARLDSVIRQQLERRRARDEQMLRSNRPGDGSPCTSLEVGEVHRGLVQARRRQLFLVQCPAPGAEGHHRRRHLRICLRCIGAGVVDLFVDRHCPAPGAGLHAWRSEAINADTIVIGPADPAGGAGDYFITVAAVKSAACQFELSVNMASGREPQRSALHANAAVNVTASLRQRVDQLRRDADALDLFERKVVERRRTRQQHRAQATSYKDWSPLASKAHWIGSAFVVAVRPKVPVTGNVANVEPFVDRAGVLAPTGLLHQQRSIVTFARRTGVRRRRRPEPSRRVASLSSTPRSSGVAPAASTRAQTARLADPRLTEIASFDRELQTAIASGRPLLAALDGDVGIRYDDRVRFFVEHSVEMMDPIRIGRRRC